MPDYLKKLLKQMKDIKYGIGCVPSVMDGTEYQYQYQKMEIPEEFSYVGVMPPVLNQGRTNKCVCYSLTAYLDWNKNQYEGDNNGEQYDIDSLYNVRARKDLEGMQIKEALKYLRHYGLNGTRINEYALVKTVESLKEALVMNGPCPAGLPFYSSQPEFWKHGTKMFGGHCILFVGYTKDGFIIRNSWGEKYADNGYIILPYSDFEKCVFECWTII